ncbi:hypothetical protein GC175_00445 [bacterium]|nr:hypothetical protein [bacterium]
MLHLNLLGPILLSSGNGEQVRLSRRKEEALLAYLATEHSHAHNREYLIGLLWPDFPSDKARLNLRVNFSNLKKRLKPWGIDGLFQATDLEIQLRVGACYLDVVEFMQLLHNGHNHPHRADELCELCRPDFARAVDLYRGPFVDGLYVDECVAYEEWLFMQRERFRVLHLNALGKLARYHQHNNEPAVALTYAHRELEVDPLREPAHLQIMQIHLAQGDRAAALRQYERCHTVLEDELGLAPSIEIQELHRQIQARPALQPVVAPPPNQVSSAHVPPRPDQAHVPVYLTPFVGRQDELDLLAERLQNGAYRLISLVGAGGIGKTRLAVEAALRQVDHFADGVYFALLASVQQARDVADALAVALGITFHAADRTVHDQLLDWLGTRRLLLVIDNFEHLLDATPLLLAILHAAPHVTLLVTSREPLSMQVEDLIRLTGLSVPETDAFGEVSQATSVRLFVDRAYRTNKSFRLHADNAADVADLCRLLEGRPLGIELAAAHTATRPCRKIAEAIRADLDFLAVNMVDVQARHRSLRAVFEQSWQALTPTEQNCLSRLSLFHNAFRLDAAIAVAGASVSTLTRLSNAHLIERHEDGERFQMHELLRQFAADKLTRSLPDPVALRRRHAEYFLTWLSGRKQILQGIQPRQNAELIQSALEDVRSAWQWASSTQTLDLVARALPVLSAFFELRGMYSTGEQLLQEALNRLPEEDEALRVQIMAELGRMLAEQGKVDAALSVLNQCIGLAEALYDSYSAGAAKMSLARLYVTTGSLPHAIRILQSAVAALPPGEFLNLRVELLIYLARFEAQLGTSSPVLRRFDEARRLVAQTGNKVQEQRLHLYHGVAILDQNETFARHLIEKALALCPDTGDRALESRILNALGFLAAWRGDYHGAIDYHLRGLAIVVTMQDAIQQNHALHNLCVDYYGLGDYPQAYRYGMEALDIAERNDLLEGIGYAQLHLGHVLAAMHCYDDADHAFRVAKDVFGRQERLPLVVEASAGLGHIKQLRSNLSAALVHVEIVCPYLLPSLIEGMDQPTRVFLHCFQVLAAAKDSRAHEILDAAYRYIQSRAVRLEPADRERFLSAVPANRAIMAAWTAAT